MEILQQLLEYQSRGIEFTAAGDKLRYRAPKNEFKEKDREKLKLIKSEVLEYLKSHENTRVIVDEQNRFEPFPLTDIQSSYLIGQNSIYKYGGTSCKIYSEFEMPEGFERSRMTEAWHEVVRNNDMLHAIVDPSGVQRILEEYEIPEIVFHDLRDRNKDEIQQEMEGIRDRLTARQYRPGTWPLYDLELSQTNERTIIHFSLDMLIADFVSINLIFDQFEQFYFRKKELIKPDLSFRDIVIYQQNYKKTPEGSAVYDEDRKYWEKRIETMPGGPELPYLDNTETSGVLVEQYNMVLPSEKLNFLKKVAQKERLTPSVIVMTAYAEVLKYWSGNKDFCMNLTMSDRKPIHPDIGDIIGDFTVVDILEVKAKGHQTFLDAARELQETLWEDMSHSSYSGVEVLRSLGQQKGGDVIIPVVFTSTMGAGDNHTSSQRQGKLIYKISQTPQVVIDCQVLEIPEGLLINWDVRKGTLMEGVAQSAFMAFEKLVNAFSDKGDCALYHEERVDLPPDMKEKRRLTNSTDTPIETKRLHEGFLRSLSEHPAKTALISQGKPYRYEEIRHYVCSVQEALLHQGFQKEEIIAVAIPKGIWQIASVIAVLAMGGTYLPIDVGQPFDRASRIIKNAGCSIVLCSDGFLDDLEGIGKIKTESLKPVEHKEIVLNDVALDKPAYIIYTSGSTGNPKGVVISHESASNTILDVNMRFGLGEKDVFLNLANLSFDLSVYDIFGAFYAGGTLVQADEKHLKDPAHWYELIDEYGVTVWNSVPAQMKMLMMYMDGKGMDVLNSLKIVMLSGDWIPTELPGQIHRSIPEAKIYSLGGATEASIWSILYPIDPSVHYERSIPYGTAMANQSFYVLNDQMREVPDWVTGDLYIGGVGLAQEYFGDAEKTAASFIEHKELGKRLYKTGDLGRVMRDGNIEFMGRSDFQVKIRGHRVEIGEIETAIREALDPKDQKVIVEKFNGSNTICSFLVLGDHQNKRDKLQLDEILKKKLPKYMLPSFYIYLDQIPLTKNGKIDRKSLKNKAMEIMESPVEGEYQEEILTDTEKIVLKIWKDLFGLDHILREDDFFDIGGNSILIVKLVTELASLGYEVTLEDIYAGPTIKEIAELLKEKEQEQGK